MQQNSLLLEEFDLSKSQMRNDQEIVLLQSAMRYKTIKNNLQLIMILNIICLIGNAFAMGFYQWFRIQVTKDSVQYDIWLNLLYVFCFQQQNYMSYRTYESSDYDFCLYVPDRDQCHKELNILEGIGKFCFGEILISLVFLSYDIIRLKHLLRAFQQQQKYTSRLKGGIVYTIIFVSQTTSLILYFVTTLCLPSLATSPHNFGICYWVNWLCCISLMIFACYYRKSKGRFLRFQIMEKLINQELSEETIAHKEDTSENL